jgi:hypothetical protein
MIVSFVISTRTFDHNIKTSSPTPTSTQSASSHMKYTWKASISRSQPMVFSFAWREHHNVSSLTLFHTATSAIFFCLFTAFLTSQYDIIRTQYDSANHQVNNANACDDGLQQTPFQICSLLCAVPFPLFGHYRTFSSVCYFLRYTCCFLYNSSTCVSSIFFRRFDKSNLVLLGSCKGGFEAGGVSLLCLCILFTTFSLHSASTAVFSKPSTSNISVGCGG